MVERSSPIVGVRASKNQTETYALETEITLKKQKTADSAISQSPSELQPNKHESYEATSDANEVEELKQCIPSRKSYSEPNEYINEESNSMKPQDA